MLHRAFFLILLSAAYLSAQVHWTCDPKGGKFIITPGAHSKKFYCWDGKIFSDEQGYTPPPSYVLSYWEEVHRKSQQIRADLERRMKDRSPTTNGRMVSKAIDVLPPPPQPSTSETHSPPPSRAKVTEIREGMDRPSVEAVLGKPYSAISIPEDDGLLEVLTFKLDDDSTARIRIKQGKVLKIE